MTIVWKALKPILVALLQVYETTLIPEMEADLDFLRSVASMINMMIQVSEPLDTLLSVHLSLSKLSV